MYVENQRGGYGQNAFSREATYVKIGNGVHTMQKGNLCLSG